jgi:hypothetical protein
MVTNTLITKERAMPLYEVDFTYTEPVFGQIELNADEETVNEEAIQHIRMSYPEAEDIEITSSRVIDDE